MRAGKTAKQSKRVVPRGPRTQKRRRGWTGVYVNRTYTTSYSAGCYVSSMQKHVHIGSFSNPRAAAVAHDAVLVMMGTPPVNCTDAEYARTLRAMCVGASVDGFLHDIRCTKRSCGKRVDSGDGATQAPPCTTLGVLHSLAENFLYDRDKPPPAHKRARVTDDSDVETPKATVIRASSSSPPPLTKQNVGVCLNETSTGAKRPRSARLTTRAAVTGAARSAVEAALAAHELVAWPSFSPKTNVINDTLFDPDLQNDAHIRTWRHALARMHFECFVDSAYAFCD